MKGLVRIVPRFNFFKLVVPPLQPGVMGLYPIHSAWFPIRLSLEGTRSYSDLLGPNRLPAVAGVNNLDRTNLDVRKKNIASMSR
jgi:hypothetical protein